MPLAGEGGLSGHAEDLRWLVARQPRRVLVTQVFAVVSSPMEQVWLVGSPHIDLIVWPKKKITYTGHGIVLFNFYLRIFITESDGRI